MTLESHFIEGERLLLREVRPDDVGERYYYWMNNSEITRYLETRFFPNTVEGLREYVTSKLEDRYCIFLAIILKENNCHIGNIKLGPIDWIHRTAEIGLMIGERECWGRGFATEAIKMVRDYGFNVLNLRKLTAGCYDANQGSLKAFQKVGFEIEGVRKQQVFCEGHYMDLLLLGLISVSDR